MPRLDTCVTARLYPERMKKPTKTQLRGRLEIMRGGEPPRFYLGDSDPLLGLIFRGEHRFIGNHGVGYGD